MAAFEELKIVQIDHVEMAVTDLEKAAGSLTQLGFARLGSRVVLERQARSILMGQNNAYIILEHSEVPEDPVAQFLAKHGEGVTSVAFLVEDVSNTLDVAARRGANILAPPRTVERDFGSVTQARIGSVGDFSHSFISRDGLLFAEGFDTSLAENPTSPGLETIEGFQVVSESSHSKPWLDYYGSIFGLVSTERRVGTERAYFLSPELGGSTTVRVIEAGSGPSGSVDFVNIHHGPGIQAIQFGTDSVDPVLAAFGRLPQIRLPIQFAVVAKSLGRQRAG